MRKSQGHPAHPGHLHKVRVGEPKVVRPVYAISWIAGICLFACSGHAQTANDPIPDRRGVLTPLPDRQPAAVPHAGIAAPDSRSLPPAAPSTAPIFVLRTLRFDASTLLTQSDADAIAQPYIGHRIGLAEIEAMRQAATALYITHGFVASGFTVPDQDVGNGVLTFRATEGAITRIDITGAHWLNPNWLAAEIGEGIDTPFNIATLSRQQQVLLRDPFIQKLNLSVQPGLSPGEAVVAAQVTEASPIQVSLGFSNTDPAATGGLRGSVQTVTTSLLGRGDDFALQYGRTQGVNDYGFAWSVPVLPDDTRVNVRYDHNLAAVIQSDLSALHISSRYDRVSVGVSRPFIRTPEGGLTLGISLDWQADDTSLLGMPFGFSPGAVNGETTVTALRFSADWLRQQANQVFAARMTLSEGLDILGATHGSGPPQPHFVSWLGQTQYIRQLYQDAEWVLRGTLQLASNPLFTLEQFPLGGIATVRGYRENELITDNAAVGTTEVRLPIGRIVPPLVEPGPGVGRLQFAPFVDVGKGWNTGRPEPDPSLMASVGVGLRWRLSPASLAEIYWGYPLIGHASGTSLEDRGIHFRIVIGVL